MATSYRYQGAIIPWANTSSSEIYSNQPVPVGLIGMGIALGNILVGATGSVQTEGVFAVPKASGPAFTQGFKVWWDAVNLVALNAPAKNAYFLGWAAEPALTSDLSVNVKLGEFEDEGPRVLTLAATGNETLTMADVASGYLTVLVPNSATKTITLPSVVLIDNGANIIVKKTATGVNAITLDPAGTEQIAGGSTYALIASNNDLAEFANTGVAWALIDSTIATIS